jgi:hypothetical protein
MLHGVLTAAAIITVPMLLTILISHAQNCNSKKALSEREALNNARKERS